MKLYEVEQDHLGNYFKNAYQNSKHDYAGLDIDDEMDFYQPAIQQGLMVRRTALSAAKVVINMHKKHFHRMVSINTPWSRDKAMGLLRLCEQVYELLDEIEDSYQEAKAGGSYKSHEKMRNLQKMFKVIPREVLLQIKYVVAWYASSTNRPTVVPKEEILKLEQLIEKHFGSNPVY